MMFVGWEGVGLCSYLLIGYYFDRQEAANASRKAFITNRIGDFGFALAIFGIIATFGTAQYADVFAQAKDFRSNHWATGDYFPGLPSGFLLAPVASRPNCLYTFVTRCDGRSNSGLRFDPRGDDGDRRSLHGYAYECDLPAFANHDAGRGSGGPRPRFCSDDRYYSKRHQEGARILDRLAAWIHVHGLRRGRVCNRHLPRDDARFFQSADVSWRRQRHSRNASRAGHAAHGRTQEVHALHVPDVPRRLVGNLRHHSVQRFLVQRRDSVERASTRYIPIGWLVWIVGTIAATCTAFYMTRLVAMTFWGKEKFLETHHEHSPGHEAHDEHPTAAAHTHIPHESPRSMWVPLAVLAVLATIGGFVGISTAFTGGKHIGGRLNIVNFLDPIIWNPATRYFGTHGSVDSYGKPLEHVADSHSVLTTHEVEPAETPPPYGHEGFNLAHAVESVTHSHTLTEWVFIIISLIVAGLGIALGWLFYVKNPRLPDIWAARLRPLYQASYHKYWVDEFFGWAVTRRTMDAAVVFTFDSKVVDGAVNGSAWLTRLSSRITGGTDQYFVDGLVNALLRL